jgi:hypothetical protein
MGMPVGVHYLVNMDERFSSKDDALKICSKDPKYKDEMIKLPAE